MALSLINKAIIKVMKENSTTNTAGDTFDEVVAEFVSSKTLQENYPPVPDVNIVTLRNVELAAHNVAQAAKKLISLLAAFDALAADDDANVSLTAADLTAAGVTDVVPAYIDDYIVGIKAETGIADLAELQAVIDAKNLTSYLSTISAYAVAEDASDMTVAELEGAGVSNVLSANLDAYKTAIAAEAGAISTAAELKAIIALVNINAYAEASDASDMTLQELTDAGGTEVYTNLAAYKVAIAAEAAIANLAAIQTVIDTVNAAAVAVIAAYASGNDASAMTVAELEAAGATDVDAANLADYKTAVEAEDTFATTAAIQTVIDTVNAA